MVLARGTIPSMPSVAPAWTAEEAAMTPEVLSPAEEVRVRTLLKRPFELMLEAVEYRLDSIVEHDIRHFELIPHAAYERIRIYVSNLPLIRAVIAGRSTPLAYVSFIGCQRDGVDEAVEATDRALIGASPATAPIVGYFSLQDPDRAWVNLVLFEGFEQLDEWVRTTGHADDWQRAAGFFTKIEKSVGTFTYASSGATISPMRVVNRDYVAAAPPG